MAKLGARKPLKLIFYGFAAGVGVLLAVSAARKKGGVITKGSKKIIGKTRRVFRANIDKLNARQKQVLALFDKEDSITNEMISNTITGVTQRTLRRDLTFLEKRGYIKQVGKTKGSYYVIA